jgi:hypothetical protein
MSQKKGNGWPDILEAALVGYEVERRRIEEKIAAIQGELRGRETVEPTAGAKSKKRVLSAAARERIAAAQRARWAAQKKQQVAPEKAKKRKISAAGLRAIREATKKRWAAYRKAQKSAA